MISGQVAPNVHVINTPRGTMTMRGLDLQAAPYVLRNALETGKALDRMRARLGTVVDVGADIGTMSAVLGFFASRVVALEPHRPSFELLRANVAHLPACETHRLALAPKPGRLTLRVVDERLGQVSGCYLSKGAPASETVTAVDLAGLKQLVAGPIDYLKIDIEGLEYDVLPTWTAADVAECRWLDIETHARERHPNFYLRTRETADSLRDRISAWGFRPVTGHNSLWRRVA